jgi:hypothetical protein
MSDEAPKTEIRTQADEDDARLEARMKAILEKRTPPPKSKTSAAGNPDWMKARPKQKSTAEPASKPASTPKRKPTTAKPPRNSEESWKLATEAITGQQDED